MLYLEGSREPLKDFKQGSDALRSVLEKAVSISCGGLPPTAVPTLHSNVRCT